MTAPSSFITNPSRRLEALAVDQSAKTVVQTDQQMRNAFLSLITHVGETKCLAFNLAIAPVDDEVMLLGQIACQLRHIDTTVILHAGQRDRAEILFGEKLEAAPPNPLLNKRVGTLVSRKAVLQSFGKYFVEL